MRIKSSRDKMYELLLKVRFNNEGNAFQMRLSTQVIF